MMGEAVADLVKHIERQRRADAEKAANDHPSEECDCPACKALAVMDMKK